MGVKVLSASWALKRFIAIFQTWSTSRSCNNFSRRLERTDRRQSFFGLLSPKTFDCYILDMMYVAFVQNFFSPILENWFALESFRPPEPKNVWFPLCRHDVRRVHEKFFLHDSKEMMGVRVISASWAQKRHDVRRVHDKFFLADSSELMGVRVISASWAEKRLIPTF